MLTNSFPQHRYSLASPACSNPLLRCLLIPSLAKSSFVRDMDGLNLKWTRLVTGSKPKKRRMRRNFGSGRVSFPCREVSQPLGGSHYATGLSGKNLNTRQLSQTKRYLWAKKYLSLMVCLRTSIDAVLRGLGCVVRTRAHTNCSASRFVLFWLRRDTC